MDVPSFRDWAVRAAEWAADYRATLADRPVRAQSPPGTVAARLPDHAPETAEDLRAIFADFERDGGRITVHANLLGETLLHRPAIRQYQLTPRPKGLLVRVVLRDETQSADALAWARRAIETEFDKVGACVGELLIEQVDRIERTGTGAKETVVSVHDRDRC